MYELDIPVGVLKSKLVDYEFVSRRTKEEIAQWIEELNMIVKFKSKLEYETIYGSFSSIVENSLQEIDGDFIAFNFTILQTLKSFTLIFDTKEDRNLFKLTWM